MTSEPKTNRWWPPLVAMAVLSAGIVGGYDYLDTKNRLELKQTAHVGCLMHHDAKAFDVCDKLRPPVLYPGTYRLCLERFSFKECVRYQDHP